MCYTISVGRGGKPLQKENYNMEKQDNRKMIVTKCIKDRFAQLLITDSDGATTEQIDNFAHNCTLALDFIGAGKIAKDCARELLVRCLNDEFENESEVLEYIANIRAPKKHRTLSPETKAKRDAIKLLKTGRYDCAKIADFVGIDEAIVIELARDLNK